MLRRSYFQELPDQVSEALADHEQTGWSLVPNRDA